MEIAPLTYKLSAYEGPLDLLYQLIQSQKIDICDIPISSLTEQYLEFLEKAEDKNMDSMSEFAVMAATLLEIKSRMLLPKIQEEEEDPRQELVDRLMEYKKVKLAADVFMSLDNGFNDVFYKLPEEELILSLKPKPSVSEILEGVSIGSLFDIFRQVMGKKELKVDKIRSSFKSVSRDMYTIEEKYEYVLQLLSESSSIRFRTILEKCYEKMEMVVTFLAVLELIKTKKIKVQQMHVFAEIEISLIS